MEIFARGEADVLVGTQMIAKGLDIARVTLVGVVSADTSLFLPDFRAPDVRSTPYAGSGEALRRTETAHSRVVVQSFNPDHYAIQAAVEHDYRGFYEGEIRFRAEHGYPLTAIWLACLYLDKQRTLRCPGAHGGALFAPQSGETTRRRCARR